MLPNETRIAEWRRGPYVMSTDRGRLDMERIHHFLSEQAYWARGLSRDSISRSVEGSIAIGVYADGRQVGFARVVTDCVRLAYLMDVFIDDEHRGHGLGTWIAEAIRTHPDLTAVTRWLLSTRDAHAVYQRAGWSPVAQPDWMMEVVAPPATPAPGGTGKQTGNEE
ncbi:GNAT family N-acetyltransferase [Bordetella genomosp. 9]|uniref:GNAT family N-acetyltransferase n=1 Tax=Bordetella genomosp. 9 TaxID=1416803 RepID=A0A261R170_9BORD|nr:GNAT family N-acetyltransferase [Bordetella genomosp. 9]OZI18795.1 GNAT family N-acetyltransferase [Bordetella genomosp. 9]